MDRSPKAEVQWSAERCPQCGERLPQDAARCTMCGHALESEPAAEEVPARPS